MTTHPSINGPGDILATIPTLLGFEPRESIVVIGARGAANMGIMMRVDRADCLIPEVAAPLARAIAAHLARDGATEAIVVTYTDADVRVACDGADALRLALDESMERVEQWAVVRGRYFCPGCADESCCPATGTVLPAPVPLPTASGPAARPNDGLRHGAMVEVGAKRRRNAARAGQRWVARRDTDPELWRDESWRLWTEALASAKAVGNPIAAAQAGKLVAALQDLRVRDAAIVSLVPGAAEAATGVLRGREDALVTAALSRVLVPAHAARPDAAHANAVRQLLATLCAHAPLKQRAPMIAILAFMAWWDGDATRAAALCEQALAVDRGYTLAELLDATIRCHLEPGWLREESANVTKRPS